VIAVGPGKVTHDGKLQPMSVKVGDKILFGKYSGNEVKLGDEEYLIMREEDVSGYCNRFTQRTLQLHRRKTREKTYVS